MFLSRIHHHIHLACGAVPVDPGSLHRAGHSNIIYLFPSTTFSCNSVTFLYPTSEGLWDGFTYLDGSPLTFLIFEHKLGLLKTCPSGTFPLLAAWRRRMSTTRDILVHNIFEKLTHACLSVSEVAGCRYIYYPPFIYSSCYFLTRSENTGKMIYVFWEHIL